MEKLINLLHTGGYSCTIANGGKIRTFTQRGVADLYDLLTQEPEFLKGALIADKVVGKGAAALMILGGIKELYTDIISTKALELFRKSDVKVDFVMSGRRGRMSAGSLTAGDGVARFSFFMVKGVPSFF